MDLATIIRRPADSKSGIYPIEQSRFVTKRQEKDINGNQPGFQELVAMDDYTQYRDNSRYSAESTEEDEISETETCAVKTEIDQGTADESFNVDELNKTESPSCCPLLVRRRSFDRNTNARKARDNYKRRSQDKRIATYNSLRCKSTSQSANASATSSNASTSEEHGLFQDPVKNCNNLNASDNSLEDVSCDFESLMHNKISELEFKEDNQNDSSTDDQSHGSRDFTMITHLKSDNNDKKVDADPFFIRSRLPQLSRPSEMFGKNFVTPKQPKKLHPVTPQQKFNVSTITSRLDLLRPLYFTSGFVTIIIIVIYFCFV